MAEYIEREALLLRIDCHGTNKFGMLDEDIRDFIKTQPAADVAPVRIGRWIPLHSEAAGDIQYCSNCKIGNAAKSDFCPHCGAIMDAWRCSSRGIDKNPTVNVVEVVRRKDCKYFDKAAPNDKGFCTCPASGMEIVPDDFCSYGER